MSTGAKILLLIIAIPIVAAFLWALLRNSIVTVPVGRIALLVVKGRPTDRVLLPGPHWVPALRKRTAVEYPALEMSYRAQVAPAVAESLTQAYGPPLQVTLGDRTEAIVEYTVRFRLDPERLRMVHDRFGPDGVWSVVRDESARAVIAQLAQQEVSVKSLFGQPRLQLQELLGKSVRAALNEVSLVMTRFSLGAADLGRTGATIQAVNRAEWELEREKAESATRLERVRNDALLAPQLAEVGELPLRYRQTDVWRDFMGGQETIAFTLPGPGGAPAASAGHEAEPEPSETGTPA